MAEEITMQDVQKIMELNSLGNPQEIKFVLQNCIGMKDYKGNIVDFNYIYNKYKQYIKWWNSRFGDRDARYISKLDAMLNIEVFVSQLKFLEEYKINNKMDVRTTYMFGDIEEVENKYNEIYGK